jgi:SAM-dependent methyltransferase
VTEPAERERGSAAPSPLADSAPARYWDENHPKTRDPDYWMAHPHCRAAINRRVTGDPAVWPLDAFRSLYAPRPFERGISWGCGTGLFERSAVRIGLVRRIDAFDVSEASLAEARAEAAREGLLGIDFRSGDFNDPRVESRRYDIAFFHASLHHVANLGRLFRRLALGLRPGTLVYVDEYVGPSRHDWTEAQLAFAQTFLDAAPAQARLKDRIQIPIELMDPSEAIRSSEIRGFLRLFLRIEQWRPYGGQIASLVFPYLDASWLRTPDGERYVQKILDAEDAQMLANPDSSHQLVAVGRVRSRPATVTAMARAVLMEMRRRRSGDFDRMKRSQAEAFAAIHGCPR